MAVNCDLYYFDTIPNVPVARGQICVTPSCAEAENPVYVSPLGQQPHQTPFPCKFWKGYCKCQELLGQSAAQDQRVLPRGPELAGMSLNLGS